MPPARRSRKSPQQTSENAKQSLRSERAAKRAKLNEQSSPASTEETKHKRVQPIGIPLAKILNTNGSSDPVPEGVDEEPRKSEAEEEQYDATVFNIDGLLNKVAQNKVIGLPSPSNFTTSMANFVLETTADLDEDSRNGPLGKKLSKKQYEDFEKGLASFYASAPLKGKVKCPICGKELSSRKGIRRHYTSCFNARLKGQGRGTESFRFSRNSVSVDIEDRSLDPITLAGSTCTAEEVKLQPVVLCEDLFTNSDTLLDVEAELNANKVKLDPLEAKVLEEKNDFLLNTGVEVRSCKYFRFRGQHWLSVLSNQLMQFFTVTDDKVALVALIRLKFHLSAVEQVFHPRGTAAFLIYSDGSLQGLNLNSLHKSTESAILAVDEAEISFLEYKFKNRVLSTVIWSRHSADTRFFIGTDVSSVVLVDASQFNTSLMSTELAFSMLLPKTGDMVICSSSVQNSLAWRMVVAIEPSPSDSRVVVALCNDRNLIFWNIENPYRPLFTLSLIGDGLYFRSLLWPAKCDYIVVGGENGKNIFYDFNTGLQKTCIFADEKTKNPSEVCVLAENIFFNETSFFAGNRDGEVTLVLASQKLFTKYKNEVFMVDDVFSKWFKAKKAKSKNVKGLMKFIRVNRFLPVPKVFETALASPAKAKKLSAEEKVTAQIEKKTDISLLYSKEEELAQALSSLRMKNINVPALKMELHMESTDISRKIVGCLFFQPEEEAGIFTQWTALVSRVGVVRLRKLQLPKE